MNTYGVETSSYDHSVKNPNKKKEGTLREPKQILEEMRALDKDTNQILLKIKELL